MIVIKELSDEDRDRTVVYQSRPGCKPDQGRITSWNDKFIFVDFHNTGRGAACRPEYLNFVPIKD